MQSDNRHSGNNQYYQRTAADEKGHYNLVGVTGSSMWPVRIGSAVLFFVAVAINFIFGMRSGIVSNQYHLYITPPALFFSIWGVIYIVLAIIVIYNLAKNEWPMQAHVYFAVSNILNIIWIILFGSGKNWAVYLCFLVLVALCITVFLTWSEIGRVSDVQPYHDYSWSTIAMRNGMAFYLGWIIAAASINLGIILVYWFRVSKEAQLIIFWILTPLIAIAATAHIFSQEKTKGLLSCFCLWISVIWAFVGAAITSHQCLNGLSSNC